MARIELITAAVEDLANSDGSVPPRVLKKLTLIEKDPEAGAPLGRRSQTNLTMFRKLIVGNRDWRIIYRIEDDGTLVVIWVIASRTEDECYDEAARRLERSGSDESVTLLDALKSLSESAQRKAATIFKRTDPED